MQVLYAPLHCTAVTAIEKEVLPQLGALLTDYSVTKLCYATFTLQYRGMNTFTRGATELSEICGREQVELLHQTVKIQYHSERHPVTFKSNPYLEIIAVSKLYRKNRLSNSCRFVKFDDLLVLLLHHRLPTCL